MLNSTTMILVGWFCSLFTMYHVCWPAGNLMAIGAIYLYTFGKFGTFIGLTKNTNIVHLAQSITNWVLCNILLVSCFPMGILPDTKLLGLRMHRECRERSPHHRLRRKPLVSYPSMHHGCMSGSLTRGGGEKRSRHSRRMRNPYFSILVWEPWAWPKILS